MAEEPAQRTGVLVIRVWMAPGPGRGRLVARLTGRLDLARPDESTETVAGAGEAARLAAEWLVAFEREEARERGG